MRSRFQKCFLLLAVFSLGLNPLFAEIAPVNRANMGYSAEITWNTDKPASSLVEYTDNLVNGYSFSTSLDPALVTAHKVILTNLKSATTYHYRLRSRDINGNEVVSKDFTLLIADPGTPGLLEISDVKASNIIAAGASLPAGPLAQKQDSSVQAPVQENNPAAGQLAKEEPVQKALIEKGALLLPRGKLQVEPSATYAHVSANKITVNGLAILPILVIGEINSEKVKRDIFIPAVSTRYGILDRLQWNVRVPYRFQYERVATSNNTETNRELSGIGDVESGLFYQLLYENGAMPALIGGFNVKSRTGKSPYGRDTGLGTGHWGLKGNLVAVKSSDPAILFASLGYTWNLERDINGFGTVDPGDAIDYSLGLAFALNYQTAINFMLEQQVTNSLHMNDSKVAGSFTNVVDFKTGLTYSISKNLSVDVVAGWGLTEDSPDFTLELRFPYTF